VGFVLDDVRESFTNDLTRFLGEIEKGSRAVVSAATLTVPPERTWQGPINSMVVGLHGIVGSSSLVGVTSLSQSARRLEDIATMAAESVRMVRAHANRLKLIATICLEGSSDLRVILEHVLAGRQAEADARKEALDKQLDVVSKEIDAHLDANAVPQPIAPERTPTPGVTGKIPPLPSASGTAKGTAPGTEKTVASGTKPGTTPVPAIPAPAAKPAKPASGSVTDDGWEDTQVGAPALRPPAASTPAPALDPDDELAAVFQAEAREALTNLRGYLTRLEQQANDREAATQCARLFHLLKGAAASVGLTEISDRARDLNTYVDKLKAEGLEPAGIARLRADTEAFIAFAVPDLATPTGGAGDLASSPAVTEQIATDPGMEPMAIFREEAQTALEEIRSLLRNLRETAGTARGALTSRIERILHRLKGSALIVGAPAIAAVASRGQALCGALDRVDPEALAGAIDQLTSMVSPAGTAAPTVGASAVKVTLPPRDEWESYLEESGEILESVDKILGLIEGSPRPAAELSNLFRSYHTLKGASNAVGLAPIGAHLHIVETFLEKLVAAPRIEDLRSVVRVLSEQNNTVRRNIARAASEGEVLIDHDRVQTQLANIGAEKTSQSSWIASGDSAWSAERSEVERAHRVRRGRRPASEDRPDSESGASQSGASQAGSQSGAESDAESEHRDDPDLRMSTERRFVRVPADRLDSLLDLAGELVVCRSRMLSRVTRIQRLQEDDLARHETVIQLIDGFAQSTQFTNLDGGRRRRVAAASGGDVMGFGALEMDQYEEIHVLSRRLDEAASDVNEVRREIGVEMDSLSDDAEMLSTIASGLQSEITRARMLTVDTLFTRLRLPIRDAAQHGGREVEILTSGEQLAIDKSMSDAMYGPLLHLVRNAVVHGIELPAIREEKGKPRAGTVRISATQEHGEIVLEISDDGAGIDLVRLREVGIARGLIPPTTEDNDPRVLDLIFAKGISTLEGADDVAGRGVGGNVVKRAVDRLNGTIQVSSKPGVGTIFRITLPLSMAITQAVVARVGGVLLAIPIAYAEMIYPRDELEIVDSFGRIRAKIGDRMVPVHQPRKTFGDSMLKMSATTDRVVILCAVGGDRVAIQVDEIVGQEEIVVKSLGMLLEGHPLFSGSTSRGDGELALIMDIPGVLEAEAHGERRKTVAHVPFAPVAAPRHEEPMPAASGGSRASSAASTASASSAASAMEPPPPAMSPVAVAVQPGIEVSEVVAIPVGRMRVLFVDDSLSVRKVAERMLSSLDVDIVTAVDGMDALEKLRAMAFSLVFTDLEMPRMHGFELIREMQLMPAYQAIPVVVISSRSGQKHIDQAISMGAREYLTKPFTPEILNAVLGRLARKG
jgi:chemosensory pili system protein ChpA (sensor histidine kinase/response regulator)